MNYRLLAFGLLLTAALCLAIAYGVGAWLDHALSAVQIGGVR